MRRHEERDRRRQGRAQEISRARRKFAPAGQSTQMIVGADAANDGDIVVRASQLYDRFRLRRVYYQRLLADPRRERGAAAQAPAADARASALPVRLADALLRVQAGRGGRGADRRRDAAARHRSQARLGAQIPRQLSGRRQPRARANNCCACPGSAPRRSAGSSKSRRWRAMTLDDVARLTVSRSPRCGRSSSPPTGARPC